MSIVIPSQERIAHLPGLSQGDFVNRSIEFTQGSHGEFSMVGFSEALMPWYQLMGIMKKYYNEIQSVESLDGKMSKVLELAKIEVNSILTQEQITQMLPMAIALDSRVFEEGELSEDELEAVAAG